MDWTAHEDLGKAGGRSSSLSPWPAMLDLVTSALMIFLLLGFLQTVLQPESLEAALARSSQQDFLAHFRSEFRAELSTGLIAVERRLDYVQVTFSDGVLYNSGDDDLQARGRALLDRSASVFTRAAGAGITQIQVEGHTDSLPFRRGHYPRDNWELSTARALGVVRYLIARELPPRLFSANGYAAQRPVDSNDSAVGRKRNRRIEIRVFFGGQSVPSAQAVPSAP